MKHEDFRIRYNEIMFDERDLIIDFLKKQADIRYGNQMYEWSLNNIELRDAGGDLSIVLGISLVEGELKIISDVGKDKLVQMNAEDFALGELSKIIDALPDADEIILKNAENDIRRLYDRCSDTYINLEDNPFTWKDGTSTFYLHSIQEGIGTGAFSYEIREDIEGVPNCENNWGFWESLEPKVARDLVNFINKKFLLESDEYKRLTKQLGWFGGNFYNFVEHGEAGSVYIRPDGTDLSLCVLDVSMEHGELEILVCIADTRLKIDDSDTMILYEKDLTPENLRYLIKFFDEDDKRHILSLNQEQMDAVEDIRKAFRKAKELGVDFICSDETANLYAFQEGKINHISNIYDFPWSDELNRMMTDEEQKEYIIFDSANLEPINNKSLDIDFGGWSTSEWYGKLIK